MQYLHTTDYYSALKKENMLTQAATWMNLENLTRSEISQTREEKNGMIHLYEVPSSQIQSDGK